MQERLDATPEEFARRLLQAIARGEPPEESYRFGHGAIHGLWREIAPLTPWEERMFSALDAATPKFDYP